MISVATIQSCCCSNKETHTCKDVNRGALPDGAQAWSDLAQSLQLAKPWIKTQANGLNVNTGEQIEKILENMRS